MPDPIIRTAADIENELSEIRTADEEHFEANLEGGKNYEAEAGSKGWVPKDKFKGPSDKWVDAQTFVERGERFNVNLQREVELLKTQIKEFEGTKAAFSKFHKETIAKKEAEFSEAIRALRVQRSDAIRNGEDDTAIDLEDQIDALKDQQKAVKASIEEVVPASAPTHMNEALIQEWIEDGNSWFQYNEKLRDYSIALGNEMLKGGETARGRKFLDLVASRMAEEFPRQFKGTQSARSDVVESASPSGAGRGKTERDLPPEDRALLAQFVKEGWMTKKDFLESYFSRNG